MALFNGEEINLDIRDTESPPKLSNREINEKYVRGEIRIVTEQARYPLNTIAEIVENRSYKLSPEYQRRHRWSRDQQSRLIESLIMNVPIPPVFLYEYDYSRYEVMDGLQRLTAIHDFYRNEFELSGLSQWNELNGRKYCDLPERVREGIDRRYLSSVILLKETAKDDVEALRLKQMVFERINSGGERLTPQETRNAIFDGSMNRLCIKLSKNDSLCRLWAIPAPEPAEIAGGTPSKERLANEDYRRMEDVELVLRFFAYRQKRNLHKGNISLSGYLDVYLRHSNGFPEDVLMQLQMLFDEVISLVEDAFGESAFWLYRCRGKEPSVRWAWLERSTTTVYDPLMYVVSRRIHQAPAIRNAKVAIQGRLEDFYKEHYETFGGRDVNRNTLIAREDSFNALFDDVVGIAT
ncbi:DUF262 domain-containing protein [uncultured Thiodictyon sp.]|jgi:hypothetical protein|uniref:DUF262 domain-containing protein n=1 Tax=uncultured Thiodictyon sp. TaxID=1846217 RepID=UPI0025DCB0F4|nr:DUF262 domain-containing protein [uncultured Thiodictyon sp.]